MFIKFARANGDVSIHECSQVHIVKISDKVVGFEIISKGSPFQEGQPGYERNDIDKKSGDEVYLMNDDGKTIDVYRWPFNNPGE